MESFVIVGYKGSQKNIIGQMLSARLSCNLVDVTEIVENREKQDSNAILELRGNDYYERIVEYNLKHIPHKDNVILLGDFKLNNEEFIRELKTYGRFIYLKAKPETILKNIQDNNETVLNLGNNEININYIENELDNIEPMYNKLANVVIEVDDKKITDLFKEVLGYYNMMTKLICHIYIK